MARSKAILLGGQLAGPQTMPTNYAIHAYSFRIMLGSHLPNNNIPDEFVAKIS